MFTASDPAAFLGADDVIDHDVPALARCAARLREGAGDDDIVLAAAAFTFVRDEIDHAGDVGDPRRTVSASQVLREGVGICFAKAHLLAAILRAEGIPVGLCYQRLADDLGGFDVHGLVAIHLEEAWHRQDPRGNKPGVDARFSLDGERLAWPVRPALGECDYDELYVTPPASVVAGLRGEAPLPSSL